MDTDQDLESLIEDLKTLFNNKQSFNNPMNEYHSSQLTENYQAPLKGTWYNSGGFTPSSATPGHPQGHMGLDMRAAAGTPIYPLTSGMVTNVGSNGKGGNVVTVQHANGIKTYYAHMSTISVHKGDRVSQNTVLGTVGTSGNAQSTFPHLHFQVWKDNQLQDPAKFFNVPKYSKLDKSEQRWISDEAKEQAQNFKIKDHLNSRRVAFSKEINNLVKLASLYLKITKTFSSY